MMSLATIVTEPSKEEFKGHETKMPLPPVMSSGRISRPEICIVIISYEDVPEDYQIFDKVGYPLALGRFCRLVSRPGMITRYDTEYLGRTGR